MLIGGGEVPEDDLKIELLSTQELELAEKVADELGSAYRAYKSLNERLTNLDEAIEKRGLEDEYLNENIICDEFVAYSAIQIPVIFVKQYEIKKDIWVAVPSTSFITDKANAEKWLTGATNHPLLGEPVDKPKSYKPESGEICYPTRFKIHPYIGKESTQELVESSIAIRKQLQAIHAKQLKVPETSSLIRSNSSTFFTLNDDANLFSDNLEKQELKY